MGNFLARSIAFELSEGTPGGSGVVAVVFPLFVALLHLLQRSGGLSVGLVRAQKVLPRGLGTVLHLAGRHVVPIVSHLTRLRPPGV